MEDTFFKLITKKPKYSGKSTFKSWLYAIGRNTAVDYIRHHSKQLDTPIEDMANYLSEEQNLEKSYIRDERKIILFPYKFKNRYSRIKPISVKLSKQV